MENAQHKTFLINSFLNVRKKTMELIKNLNPEDMVIQTEPFVSPIKWHLAHTTWFFENFVLKNFKNYKIFDKSFNYIFNSKYIYIPFYSWDIFCLYSLEFRATKTCGNGLGTMAFLIWCF